MKKNKSSCNKYESLWRNREVSELFFWTGFFSVNWLSQFTGVNDSFMNQIELIPEFINEVE